MSEGPQTHPADAVEAALGTYFEREQLAHGRMASAFDTAIDQPINERLHSVASAHRVRLDALRTVPVATGLDQPAVRDAILGYRRSSVDEVLRPLCETLARLDCGDAVSRLNATLKDELASAVSDAPDRLQRPEPPALYLHGTGDVWHRATRKALIRAGRHTRALLVSLADRLRRVAGREPRPLPGRVQDVPLRQLVAYHTAVRLPAVHARVIRSLQATHAARIAGLESAASQWINALLALESTLDTAGEKTQGPPAPATYAEGQPEEAGLQAETMDAIRIGERLQASLDAANDTVVSADFGAHLAAADAELRADVAHIGSFMLRDSQRAAPAQPVRASRETERANSDWTTWHRQAVSRLRLDIAAADFRDVLIRRRTDLARVLQNDAARPIDHWLAETADALRDLRVAVEHGCARARAAADASALRVLLRSVEKQALEILGRETPYHLTIGDLERISFTAADGCIDGVLDGMNRIEEVVAVHERPLPGVAVQPAARAVRVRVRDMAEQAFDVVLLEKIRTSTRPADEVFSRVVGQGRELEEVIRFNLGAALDEIGVDEPDSAQLDGAEELALNGLDRSVSALLALGEQVRFGVEQAEQAARQATQAGWDRFHDRVMVEDRVQDQLLDIRYRIRSVLREAVGRTRRTVEHFLRKAAGHAAAGQVRVLQLLRFGRAVVEGERVSLEERRATVDALSSIGSVLAGLPLVYRRLFSLRPVEDPALLVGRDADLGAVRQHFDHWRMGITDALVITGGHGSGRTSLLNILRETLLDGADVHSVVMTERCLEEAAFVRMLEPALPVEPGSITTFVALVESLREAAPPERPRVIIIEELEHALLRTAAGNGLLGRIFSLMSRTDSHIFWLGTMGRSGWDYIERTEPLTPGLVRHYPLSAHTRDQIEDIVMRRHMRSGLPIRFENPPAPNPALGRRLRRAGNEAQRQVILRTEFFDRLYRASGQDVTLALFYWLRSATVDGAKGTLDACPLEPLNFGHLQELSLPQCFALKAFLDHGSLTLDEYSLVFGTRPDEARAVFESLGNQLLIESAAPENVLADFRFSTIADDARYRIRPLVMHPVTGHLRGRNLLLPAS